MTAIYTITALTFTGKNTRTWGWYPTYAEAERHVQCGDDLLLEGGTFQFLLIEELPEGCPVVASTQWWFRATLDPTAEDCIYHVAPCDPPDWAFRVTNFSMG